MKYLKKYKIFESSEKSIKAFCEQNNIVNYVINNDGSITINQNVIIQNYMLFAEIDIKEINGDLKLTYFDGNTYNDLDNPDFFGCPKKVTGNFYLEDNYTLSKHGNRIKSLRGCPLYVGGNFLIHGTGITNLKYLPEYIGGRIDVTNNKIESLVDIKDRSFDNSKIYCSQNKITDLCGYKPKEFHTNPIYVLVMYLVRQLSDSMVNVDNMSNELLDRLDEFGVIDGNKIDQIKMEQLFEFYNEKFNSTDLMNRLQITMNHNKYILS